MRHLIELFILILFYSSIIEAQTNANIAGPENVLVVYYLNSTTSDSVQQYYTDKRNIPSVNVCALNTLPDSIQITVDNVTHWVGIRQGTDDIRDINNHNSGTWYATEHAWKYFYQYIAAPIKDYITTNNLTNTIRYIVLCKGVPSKVQAAGDHSGALCNVTLDGLLCMLNTNNYEGFLHSVYVDYRSRAINGTQYYYHPMISNPYYSGTSGVDPNNNFNFRFQSDVFTSSWNGYTVKLSYLVSHIDGINNNVVEDIIDRAANPDMSGTASWILDDDPQLGFASFLFTSAKDSLEYYGFNVVHNNTNAWITSYTGNIIGYSSKGTHAEDGNCNWEDSAWVVDSLNFNWANGAIYNSLESFNGQSLSTLNWRYVTQGPPDCHHTQGLATQSTIVGGTGFMAHAWEPIFSPYFGVLDFRKTYPSYAMGYGMIDAYYQGIVYLAWQNVVVGDPLTTIAWGKQTTTQNLTISGTNLITGIITITAGDTIAIQSGATIRLRHNGFITSNESSVITIGSNVTLDSDSWDRGLLLTNNHDHPQLLWSVNPSMSPISYYKVYRKLNSGSWTQADSTTGLTWTDNELNFESGENQQSIHAYYYVKSFNSTSSSDPSNTVDANCGKSREKAKPESNIDQFAYKLEQNYPNPFNPATQINYSLKNDGFVSLKVFDILGREVANLVNQNQKSGYHTVNFDASNLPSGVYIYTLKTTGFTSSKKMSLIK